MLKPYRFEMSFNGGTSAMRVQSHNTDSTLLVVKHKHPETVDELITLTGLDPKVKKTFKGSNYFITFCEREALCSVVSALCSKISEESKEPMKDDVEEVDEEAKDYDGDEEVN